MCAKVNPKPAARNGAGRVGSTDRASEGTEQVISIEVLPDTFDPAEFVTWDTNWIVKRDWGKYS